MVNETHKKILIIKRVIKKFPGTIALNEVNFDLNEGEIHAIVGENGAGKSTLIKIICGALKRDSGLILFNGQEINFHSTKEALNLGISTIYQEMENIPQLTIAENIFIGVLPRKKRMPFLSDRRLLFKKAEALLKRLDIEIKPNIKLSEISVANQQLIEVAKALSRKVKILIMDEPTSSLSKEETEKLFKIMRNLKKQSISIIYISHRLKEVMEIADRVSIFRNGENVQTLEKQDIDEDKIINLMIGHKLTPYKKSSIVRNNLILEVQNLNIYKKIYNLSFSLYSGEILGLVGLVGCGKDELVKSLFGIWPCQSIIMFLGGKKIRINSPVDALANNILYLPEERKTQSLFLEQSVRKNFTPIWLNKVYRKFFISNIREMNIVNEYVEKLSIKVANIEYKVSTLSGGNQQKIILGRLLSVKPKVLILHDPTKGIDVGSKEEIREIIWKLAQTGSSIIFTSSEMSEICELSNRVLAISNGRIREEFVDNEITEEKILSSIMKTY